MSTAKTKFTVKFSSKNYGKIKGWRERANNPSQILEKIGEEMSKNNLKRFDREVEPNGRAWEPLAPSTLSKRKKNKSGKKLFDTGRLRNSIRKSTVTKKARKHRNFEIAIDSKVPYSGIQQRSKMSHAKRPLTNPRRFLGHGKGEMKKYSSMLVKYISKGIV